MSEALLPHNQTPLEAALAKAMHHPPDPSPIKTLWNPRTCPAHLLPWLAWSLSVDEWDDTWPEETRRRVIAESLDVHRRKGTVAAVRRVFAQIGFGEIDIDEGRHRRRYDGTMKHDGFPNHGDASGWPYYRVRMKKLLSAEQAASARRLLADNAPTRSELWSIDFTEAALLYNAVARYDGRFNHGEY